MDVGFGVDIDVGTPACMQSSTKFHRLTKARAGNNCTQFRPKGMEKEKANEINEDHGSRGLWCLTGFDPIEHACNPHIFI